MGYIGVWVPDLLERDATIVHADGWYEIELHTIDGKSLNSRNEMSSTYKGVINE